MTLPPLPYTRYFAGVEGDGYSEDRVLFSMPAWVEEAVREYGAACAAAERERCASICDQLAVMSLDPMVCRGSAEECAAAIRAQD